MKNVLKNDVETQNISVAEDEMSIHYANEVREIGVQRIAQASPDNVQKANMAWIEFMTAFEHKYNCTQRSLALKNDPAYSAELLELDHRARNTNMSYEEYGVESTKIMQKFMPDVPFEEFTKAAQKVQMMLEE